MFSLTAGRVTVFKMANKNPTLFILSVILHPFIWIGLRLRWML
jgi:hypothetical protein